MPSPTAHGRAFARQLTRALVAAWAAAGAIGAAQAQDAVRGAALYRELPRAPGVGSCISCHGEPLNNRNSVLRGAAGGAVISRTIAAVGAMGFLRQFLGESDLADIAAYLATVLPPAALDTLPEPWPTFDDFGVQAVGTQAPERVLLVRNLQPRNEVAIGTVTSSDALAFPVQHECPLSLPPLAQCRVRTWFRPQALGAAEARFDILAPGGEVLRSGRLLGTGAAQQPGRLAWEPAGELVDFGRVEVGRSAVHTLRLHNPSAQAVLLQRLRVTGPQALRFGLAAACAGAVRIEAGERRAVTLTHTPRAPERAEGWVELACDASNAPLLRVQALGVPAAEAPLPAASQAEPEATGGGAFSWRWLLVLLAAVWVLAGRRRG